MNRGGVGARSLNLDLQTALNPQRQDQPVVERFGFTYRVGDKVMQIQNDYEKDAFNGDIGFVAAIDTDEAEVVIDFDGRQIVYEFGELDEVVLAYATTIHKSQGSESPAVVIPILTQHYPMLQRNLLYTGITRGKRLVAAVSRMDKAVDKLDEAVKLYVTRLTRESLDERDGHRAMEIISFSINLEHIGDIIDKNLMELAQKKIKRKLAFSKQGAAELEAFHQEVMGNLN